MAVTPTRIVGSDIRADLTYEEPEVARYITITGSDGGFPIPNDSNPLSDLHLDGIHAAGLQANRPAVLFFRTHQAKDCAFSIRLNSTPVFQYTPPNGSSDEDIGARSWHEIIAPGALKPEDNALTLAVSSNGKVTFSDIVIQYTSNRLTVTRPAVFDPTPG